MTFEPDGTFEPGGALEPAGSIERDGAGEASSFTWTDEAGPVQLEESAALRALEAALAHGGHADRVVDVIVVGKSSLAEMHGQFLGDPSETDVITFDLADDEGMGGPDGEIYISADRAREVSADRGVPVSREVALYVVHGALHLCGMDDHADEDRARMRVAEAQVMASLGYSEDRAPHDLAD